MADLTFPFLVRFYELAKDKLQPGVAEWIVAQARASSGGLAYPANRQLDEQATIPNGVDAGLYRRVYNACVRKTGAEFAAQLAREVAALPDEQDSNPVSEAELEGLSARATAFMLWNLANPEAMQEMYSQNLAKVPDYVPADKKKRWAAMWDAIFRDTGDESKAFAITNAKFLKSKKE